MQVKAQAILNSDSRKWVAAGLFALVAVCGRKALYSLAQSAWSISEYSHIMLVPPIVLAFLLAESGVRPDAREGKKPSALPWAAAIFLLLVGLGLASASSFGVTLQVAGIVLAVWMTVGLVFGWGFFKASLFPMLFLLLLIPWPAEVVAWLTRVLQAGSTTVSYWLFKLAGVSVTRHGFVLSLPTIDIEVAKECSGIRSTIFLFLTALVLAQLYLRSPWNKALVALAVLPIGIVRNAMRIFILSMLGAYVNEGWLDGNLHHRGGAVFFVIGLALIVVLVWCFRRLELRTRCGKPAPGAGFAGSRSTPGGRAPAGPTST